MSGEGQAINLNDKPDTSSAVLDRRSLAKAITLIESSRPEDRTAAETLLAGLPPAGETLRIGLSGAPGVGKSTFIEAMGVRLAEAGRRLAVLAVDPSSSRSGGAILGDKTRMERLTRHPNAFIRPSPAGRELGGVARRTREAIRLVEAAGYTTVIVETVGVGQSETLVAEMTDIFVLLVGPGGGDELQGVKRGIMEVADLIFVTKADGGTEPAARATAADYAGALHLMRPRAEDPPGYPKAMALSAETGAGLDEGWAAVEALAEARQTSGAKDRSRAAQRLAWFRAEFGALMREHLDRDPATAALRASLERQIAAGEISATAELGPEPGETLRGAAAILGT
ncbi:MAG: methylmalonyl Co-A mutase-associated GTPase MeaB [Pseudomonadota bacterium]